jgi:hypothetical protein
MVKSNIKENKMVYPIFSFGWNGHMVQSNQHSYIRIHENDLESMRPPLQSNEIPQQYLSSSYNKCEYE